MEVTVAEVFKNGTKTCIVVGAGEVYTNYIPLDDGGLKVCCDTNREFSKRDSVNYPVQKAAKKYLEFAKLHGATDQALRLLKEIINGEPKKDTKMGKRKVTKEVISETVESVDAPPEPKRSKRSKDEKAPSVVIKNAEKLNGNLLIEIGNWIKKRKNPPTRQQVLDSFVEKGHPKVSIACCITAGIRSGALELQ